MAEKPKFRPLKPVISWHADGVIIKAGLSWFSVSSPDRGSFVPFRLHGVDACAAFCGVVADLKKAGRQNNSRQRNSSGYLFTSRPYELSYHAVRCWELIHVPDGERLLLNNHILSDLCHWLQAASSKPLPAADSFDQLAVNQETLSWQGRSYHIIDRWQLTANLLAVAGCERADTLILPLTGEARLEQTKPNEFVLTLKEGSLKALLHRSSLGRLALAIHHG